MPVVTGGAVTLEKFFSHADFSPNSKISGMSSNQDHRITPSPSWKTVKKKARLGTADCGQLRESGNTAQTTCRHAAGSLQPCNKQEAVFKQKVIRSRIFSTPRHLSPCFFSSSTIILIFFPYESFGGVSKKIEIFRQ